MTPINAVAQQARDLVACLMCSPIYFDLPVQRRLGLIKSLLAPGAPRGSEED